MLDAGTPVRLQKGRLELQPPTSPSDWSADARAARGEFRLPKQGLGSWIVQLHAEPRRFWPCRGRLHDRSNHRPGPERKPLDAAKLSQRLGLSTRQAQAITALLKDGTEESACAKLGVSKATLHTHVTRVYARSRRS